MRNFLKGLLGAAILATGMAGFSPAPVAAQGFSIEVGPRGVEVNRARSFCERNPGARECREYRRDDRRWDRDDRRGDRYDRRRDRDDRRAGPGRVSRESVARCAQRYRSYDPRTHTYVVNSRGDRRVCQL